jgi:YHS domain-containing protein
MLQIVVSLVLLTVGPDGRRTDQDALKSYGPLVGEWRGVGQPQRGSNKGAWTESGDWKWTLTKDSAALELTVTRGKLLRSAVLKPDKEPGRFVLEARLADGSKRNFRGKVGERNVLTLTAEKDNDDGPARITLTPLHETRFLLLLEGRSGDGFRRLAEVGYTRKGVAFAAGDSAPPCIVTDGKGTIPVKHKGTTYYVCCSGCKDLFEADPDAVIAEAESRRKAAK